MAVQKRLIKNNLLNYLRTEGRLKGRLLVLPVALTVSKYEDCSSARTIKNQRSMDVVKRTPRESLRIFLTYDFAASRRTRKDRRDRNCPAFAKQWRPWKRPGRPKNLGKRHNRQIFKRALKNGKFSVRTIPVKTRPDKRTTHCRYMASDGARAPQQKDIQYISIPRFSAMLEVSQAVLLHRARGIYA